MKKQKSNKGICAYDEQGAMPKIKENHDKRFQEILGQEGQSHSCVQGIRMIGRGK